MVFLVIPWLWCLQAPTYGRTLLFGLFPSWWCQRSCKAWGERDPGVKSRSTTAWWGPCYCEYWCQCAPVISNFFCLFGFLFAFSERVEAGGKTWNKCSMPQAMSNNLSPLLYVCHIVLWVRHSLSLLDQIGKSSRIFFPLSSSMSSFSFFFEKPSLPLAAHWRLY